MSKYTEDQRFLRADKTFQSWTKTDLRDELVDINNKISILIEQQRLLRVVLHSRNTELYEFNKFNVIPRVPSDKPGHE